MEERGFYFTAEEREEFGISVALVWEPTEKDLQLSIMLGNIWHPGNGYGLRFCLCGYLFTEERVGILMQTQDIIRVLQSSDRLQIKKGKTLIYAGYVASMEHTDIEEEILSAEVKRFQAVPEIRHKEWQKRGLMKPLQPEETPEYNFSDLQMSIYHTITI